MAGIEIKNIGDAVSIATVSGALMEILPPVAALLTIIWSMIRIYETRTVQRVLGRNPQTRDEDE